MAACMIYVALIATCTSHVLLIASFQSPLTDLSCKIWSKAKIGPGRPKPAAEIGPPCQIWSACECCVHEYCRGHQHGVVCETTGM